MKAFGGLGTCFFLGLAHSGLVGFFGSGGNSTGGIHRMCSSAGVSSAEGEGGSSGTVDGLEGGEETREDVADDRSCVGAPSESASDNDSEEGEGLG